MPTNIQVIHPHDFIRATADGVLDRDTSLKLLLAIAAAAQPLRGYRILLDTRKGRTSLSAFDLWYLAEGLATQRAVFGEKTAVLCPAGQMANAEFFALCASNRGLRVAAFTSFEDAIEWLIAEWADA